MKQFLVIFLALCFSVQMSAQMSDTQVIEYVKAAHDQGKSQNEIGTALLQKGVTQAQMERIKTQIEQQRASQSSNSATGSQFSVRDVSISETVQNVETTAVTVNIFGKNIFNKKNLTFAPDLNIPTPSNYRLGTGDEIVIDVWGASQATIRRTISPEGTVSIENIGPVYLNGLTIADANVYLKNKMADVYSGVNEDNGASSLKLTLGNIRTIQVNVIGEVAVPGTYTLTSLSSVFNALYVAGGINDIGSLREINVYRNGKKISTIDVYDYLLYGKISSNITLQEEDVIIVPTYKSLVKIQGKIKRPMYYEMKPEENLNTLIEYAGGFESNAYKDEFSLTRKTGFYDQIYTVNKDETKSFALQDGDVVNIRGGFDMYENRVHIDGRVFRPGYYEVGKDIKTVKDLITSAGGLREDAFLDRAILTRRKDDLTYETLALNLSDILSGKNADIVLVKDDNLYINSQKIEEDLGAFIIHGLVAKPGTYAYVENTSVQDLILKAGGLLSAASVARVDVARRIIDPTSTSASPIISEIFSFPIEGGLIANGKSEFILEPYDQVYIRRSPGYHAQRNVTINGEVLFPGGYTLESKTERISDVIKKAGGLTDQAYVKGARLIREESAKEKRERLQSIRRLGSTSSDSISTKMVEDINYSNIGIELDLALAKPHSEYDIVLHPGDQLVIPEYDNTVKIIGAVMYPNTIVYKAGKPLKYYIDQAGGYSEKAKKNKGYVVYMNGMTAVTKGGGKNLIQPGCEIIIPMKEEKAGMTLGEKIAIGSSVTSMASVIALLINSLTK